MDPVSPPPNNSQVNLHSLTQSASADRLKSSSRMLYYVLRPNSKLLSQVFGWSYPKYVYDIHPR